MSQNPDIFKPVHRPTRREEDRRKAELEAQRAKPQPIKDKPGFFIDKDGRFSYDPAKDPKNNQHL
jgi:hypothetical protein